MICGCQKNRQPEGRAVRLPAFTNRCLNPESFFRKCQIPPLRTRPRCWNGSVSRSDLKKYVRFGLVAFSNHTAIIHINVDKAIAFLHLASGEGHHVDAAPGRVPHQFDAVLGQDGLIARFNDGSITLPLPGFFCVCSVMAAHMDVHKVAHTADLEVQIDFVESHPVFDFVLVPLHDRHRVADKKIDALPLDPASVMLGQIIPRDQVPARLCKKIHLYSLVFTAVFWVNKNKDLLCRKSLFFGGNKRDRTADPWMPFKRSFNQAIPLHSAVCNILAAFVLKKRSCWYCPETFLLISKL